MPYNETYAFVFLSCFLLFPSLVLLLPVLPVHLNTDPYFPFSCLPLLALIVKPAESSHSDSIAVPQNMAVILGRAAVQIDPARPE